MLFLPSVADTISRLYLTLIAVLYQTTLWEQTHVTSRLPRERCTRSSLWLRKNTLPEKAKISVKQVSFIAKLKIRGKHWHACVPYSKKEVNARFEQEMEDMRPED